MILLVMMMDQHHNNTQDVILDNQYLLEMVFEAKKTKENIYKNTIYTQCK